MQLTRILASAKVVAIIRVRWMKAVRNLQTCSSTIQMTDDLMGRRTCFGGSICKLPRAAPLHDTRNRRHIHHRGSIPRRNLPPLRQQRQKRSGHEKLRCQIRLKRLGPLLRFALHQVLGDSLRGAEIWLAGFGEARVVVFGDAGVVDEEVDPL